MTGVVFDVQRFSVHDGPGIRTTVFMKGCPLRCKWCHNPEGLSKLPQLQFFEDQCLGCGACGTRKALSDAERCPAGALKICGRTIEDGELVQEILKDRIFYGNDGGVTFSGGECLLQADFVASVLESVKTMGVHTAVDTCGYVPWSEIQKTVDFCDLYLYDVKCVSPSVHREYTGVDNSLIIENLKRLSEMGKEIWIRVPVIPNFNNSEKEMMKIVDLVSSLPSVKQVSLMPYHSLGASKYKTLGLEYQYDPTQKISEDQLACFREMFARKQIPVC